MHHRGLSLLAAALLGAALSAACSGNTTKQSTSSSSNTGSGGDGQGGATMTTGGGEGGIGQGGIGGDGSGGGVGGQGGSGGSTGDDVCPGDPYTLEVGAPLVLGGSTVGLTDDYSSYCGIGSGSGADAVYAITAEASGTMTVTLDSTGGLNGVLYAQEMCGATGVGSFINCQDQGPGLEVFSFDAQEGAVYHVFVDGRDQTEGDYLLTASLLPGVCGDGVVNEPQEDCDFGDTNPGDGCDANCQFETPADNSDACPGQVTGINPGVPVVITSHTTGYTDNYTSCGAVVGAPDRVFALFPSASGTITVTLPNLGVGGGGFDGVLAAWVGACEPGNLSMPPYLGCSDGPNAGDTEMMMFPVTAGTLYFVVIDGYADYSYGNFQATFTLN